MEYDLEKMQVYQSRRKTGASLSKLGRFSLSNRWQKDHDLLEKKFYTLLIDWDRPIIALRFHSEKKPGSYVINRSSQYKYQSLINLTRPLKDRFETWKAGSIDPPWDKENQTIILDFTDRVKKTKPAPAKPAALLVRRQGTGKTEKILPKSGT